MRPLRILHVIPSISPSQGGPSFAIRLIARSVAEHNVSVEVVTTDDDGPGKRLDISSGKCVLNDGYKITHFPKQSEFYKISLPLSRWVRENVARFDLVHAHALFSHAPIAAASHARQQGIPYVIRPLGVLNQWGMRHRRRWIKALSFRWRELPLLHAAAAIHYTSRIEQHEAEMAGVRSPGHVIPLGIDLTPFENLPGSGLFLEHFPGTIGRKVVLFMSRIDPKKGLDLLLPAFTEVYRIDPLAILVLAGGCDPSYAIELRRLISRLGIEEQVIWTGFLKGELKLSALCAAAVYILPSYSENFGIAAVEAMASGAPSIFTPGVAVSEGLKELKAALVPQPTVSDVAAAVSHLLVDEGLAREIGKNGREAAFREFSMHTMGSRLATFYTETSERFKSNTDSA